MRDLVVFALAGAGVYGARASFIVIVGDRRLPAWAERALRNVGPAVLAALITSLLLTDGLNAFVTDPARVTAVVVSIPTALRTRNFVWTFAAGMAAFWIVGAVFR
jgi:branched-subunit amino acid transport protein